MAKQISGKPKNVRVANLRFCFFRIWFLFYSVAAILKVLLLSAAESGGCNLFVHLLICWQLNTNRSPAWHVGETLQKFFHDPILSSGCVGKATCQQWWSKLNKSHKLAGWLEYDKVCQSFWTLYIYIHPMTLHGVSRDTLGWYIQSIGLDR